MNSAASLRSSHTDRPEIVSSRHHSTPLYINGAKLLFPVSSAHHQESEPRRNLFCFPQCKKKLSVTIFLISLTSRHRVAQGGKGRRCSGLSGYMQEENQHDDAIRWISTWKVMHMPVTTKKTPLPTPTRSQITTALRGDETSKIKI